MDSLGRTKRRLLVERDVSSAAASFTSLMGARLVFGTNEPGCDFTKAQMIDDLAAFPTPAFISGSRRSKCCPEWSGQGRAGVGRVAFRCCLGAPILVGFDTRT